MTNVLNVWGKCRKICIIIFMHTIQLPGKNLGNTQSPLSFHDSCISIPRDIIHGGRNEAPPKGMAKLVNALHTMTSALHLKSLSSSFHCTPIRVDGGSGHVPRGHSFPASASHDKTEIYRKIRCLSMDVLTQIPVTIKKKKKRIGKTSMYSVHLALQPRTHSRLSATTMW